MELLASIGRGALGSLAYLGGLARLSGRSAYYTLIGPFRGKPLRFGRAIHQAMAVGVEALPILSVITFFIGVILALGAVGIILAWKERVHRKQGSFSGRGEK